MLEHVVLIASMVCFSPPNSATFETSETGSTKFRTVMLTKYLVVYA